MDTNKPVCIKCRKEMKEGEGNLCYECYEIQVLTETADKLYRTLQEIEEEKCLEEAYQDFAMTSEVFNLPVNLPRFELYLALKDGNKQHA